MSCGGRNNIVDPMIRRSVVLMDGVSIRAGAVGGSFVWVCWVLVKDLYLEDLRDINNMHEMCLIFPPP